MAQLPPASVWKDTTAHGGTRLHDLPRWPEVNNNSNLTTQAHCFISILLLLLLFCFLKLAIDSCFFPCVCPAAGQGGPCPAGHYCPRASVSPRPCPRGTYSNLSKLVSQVSLFALHWLTPHTDLSLDYFFFFASKLSVEINPWPGAKVK